MIWSCDTGQWILDSCQLNITWMSSINDVPMVMVLLSYFSRYGAWCMEVRMDGQRDRWTDGQMDNQNFLDQCVTKYSTVWSSTTIAIIGKAISKILFHYFICR